MLFFPYRFDLGLNRVPWLTILITLTCIAVYAQQAQGDARYAARTELFCRQDTSQIERMALEKATGDTSARGCVELMHELTAAEDPAAVIADYAAKSRRFAGLGDADSQAYIEQLLTDRYRSFRAAVPPPRTRELWYAPESWDPVTMVTSSFSHGGVEHLVGNLVFFYAFAAAVELIIGSAAFFAVILAMAFGTGVAYSLAMLNVEDALPTVGLSGIVMGMMAMLAWFMPRARIRCFYWFLVWFGTVAVPAWLLALFYIGFDVHTLLTGDDMGGINLVAHVSGAVLGVALAATVFRGRKRALQAGA